MSRYEKNEISILNDIVYEIYNIKDLDEMRLTFLKSVNLLIPYERSSFYLSDKEGEHLLTNPVGVNFPAAALARYITEIEDEDPTRWIFIHAKNMVYREKDLFSEESIETNKCFQDYYSSLNLYYSLQISLSLNNEFLGSLSFYRTEDQPDFSDKDLFLFDMFKNHLASRLYMESKKNDSKAIEINTSAIIESYKLTLREVEILEYLINGLQVDKISDSLHLSPNTVRKHISNIYRKLGVTNRLELLKIL